MAKIRHIAIQVPDLEKAAHFYETVLELQRIGEAKSEIGDAIILSDGVVNLTLLSFPEGTRGRLNGPEWAGLHHFGVIVDDEHATARKIEAAGGGFFMKIPEIPGITAETKYKDPMGVVFDVSEHDWQQAKNAASAEIDGPDGRQSGTSSVINKIVASAAEAIAGIRMVPWC